MKNNRTKRVSVSIKLTPEGLAALKKRASQLSERTGIDVRPASLAAHFVHGALGFLPDGVTLKPEPEEVDSEDED